MIPEWTVGDRLRKARETTGLTTIEFAALIGISPASVNNAERGRHRPRKVVITAWAAETGVSAEWLREG